MLEQAAGLTPETLRALAELERQVVSADGGRLKLEWDVLRHRSGDRVEDLLWWEGDRLVGFLGVYGFDSTPELAGMVAPDARRRGIASALLDAAMPLCRERSSAPPLLIVPSPSTGGRYLATRRGGTLDHSEHALVLAGDLAGRAETPAPGLRLATTEDVPVIARLLGVGFGGPAPDDVADRLGSPGRRIFVIELGASAVGTLRLHRDGDLGSIYAFVIDPSSQGRGIGRQALIRACELLRTEGVRRIGLEVAVDNDRALSLYTAVGFNPVITEDYYALPFG